MSGSILQAGVQSYFAINDVQDHIAQMQADVVQNRFMSYGTFHTYLHPTQRYGIIFGASLNSGMQMDIDRILTTAVDKDNSSDKLSAYIRSQGPRESLNENLVPEMLFDNPDTPEKEVEGVSAVKAIQLASQQGQKIFTITRENYNEVLPQLNLGSDVMTDIRNAINAGHEVTTHEHNINFHGWKGAGYIIIDPNNGAGAYLISGGANGAFIAGFGLGASFAATLFLLAFGPLGIIAGLVVLGLILAIAITYYNILFQTDEEKACSIVGFGIGAAVVGLIPTVVEAFASEAFFKIFIGKIITSRFIAKATVVNSSGAVISGMTLSSSRGLDCL
ncbi:hypothetical protein [Psychrobacter sp. I-STPA6b]|uniref:hypothetical protein n=1 Tax=Psychrobacter sp. I-STPA6b TaxID=2585718 RepID=UPI001D0C7B2C|nr:hypothetical protein [Psychrobacter sp. I-STPA6b]